MRLGIQLFFCLGLIVVSNRSFADDQSECKAGKGTYVTGEVVSGPKFVRGKFKNGVELSHTHLKIRVADDSSKVYDVAIDNVFANGYKKNQKKVPPPLNAIKVGNKVALCGQEYTGGTKGIHWVHNDCNKTPNQNQPNGFVKLLNPDGTSSENMEGLTQYCELWP